jgi:hypothetical protein
MLATGRRCLEKMDGRGVVDQIPGGLYSGYQCVGKVLVLRNQSSNTSSVLLLLGQQRWVPPSVVWHISKH